MAPNDVIELVLAERQRQARMWGDAHDEHHDYGEWLALLSIRLAMAMQADMNSDPAVLKKRLVQVAALAIAALEAKA